MIDETGASELLRLLAHGAAPHNVEAAKELARRNERSVLDEVCELLLHGASAQSRELAAWLLGELSPGTDVTVDALHAIIRDEAASDELRCQAIESLGNQVCELEGSDAYQRSAALLVSLLTHVSVEILYNAIFALGTMRCLQARSELQRIAVEDVRMYNGLETIGQAAHSAIDCIDTVPRGRKR